MEITVEKVDDVNFIIKGSVQNSVIDERVSRLKTEAQNADESEGLPEQNHEQIAAGQVFQEFVDAGIKKAEIALDTLLGQPGLKKYEKQEDKVLFEVDIAVSPKIDTDITYDDIVPSFTKPKPSEEEVEAKLQDFAQKQAPFTPIETPKSLENDDIAVIDFVGYLRGEPFEGGKAEQFKLQIGSGKFIPGFEEQLLGMEYGEERTIKVTFPENYQSADLAGQETEFKVKFHEIHEQKPVETDDDFAKKILNDETATLDTLKEKLGDQIVAQEISDLYNQELKPKLVEGLLGKFDFILPNNIVEQEIDAKVRELLQPMSEEEQRGYLEDKEKFHALRDSVRKEAQNGIKIAMIIEALAEKEGITVDEQEVLAALGHHAMMTGQNAQELEKYYRENNLMTSAKLSLTEDKLYGRILGFDK